jgi:hypothetical protein
MPAITAHTAAVREFSCQDSNFVAQLPAEFPNPGVATASFQLTLALDAPSLIVSEPQFATIRLSFLDSGAKNLDTSLPLGDYVLSIVSVDGKQVVPSSHPGLITVIRTERVSTTCPSYQRFDLRSVFSLAPGQYRLTASRILLEDHWTTNYGTVRSNEVEFSVLP